MGRQRLTTPQILSNAIAAWNEAEMGRRDLIYNPDAARKYAGISILVIKGRASTQLLNKLKSTEETYGDWWAPHAETLETDPLMKYFNNLRSAILKEGLPQPVTAELISSLDGSVIADVAVGGDSHGIWISGGLRHEIKKDIELNPQSVRLRAFRLPNPPTHHLETPISDTTMEKLGTMYLRFLRDTILDRAVEKFGRPSV
jgi:hypothetical protein